jgi:hypothetical protein
MRATVNETFGHALFMADTPGVDSEDYALKVLGERALAAQVWRELRNHNCVRGNGMHELEKQKLPRVEEQFVVFAEEVDWKQGVEVDKEKVDG